MRPRLVTIPISHYGERARWALDLAEIDYDETHHLQMFSWVAALRTGGHKTLPVLVTSERALTDSGDILRWASERAPRPFFPRDASARAEVERLSHELAGEFGVEGRKVVYAWAFEAFGACLPYNAGRCPSYQLALLSVLREPAKLVLRRHLRVTPAQVHRAVEVVERTLDSIAERLVDGRRYLVGDAFSAADLTYAAMCGPSLLPARYGVRLPPLSLVPAEARARIERWRAHPAGRFALRLYEERPAPRGTYERASRAAAL